jgi:hypothetical protein
MSSSDSDSENNNNNIERVGWFAREQSDRIIGLLREGFPADTDLTALTPSDIVARVIINNIVNDWLNDPEAIARFQSVLEHNILELHLAGNVSDETAQQALQQAIDTTPLRGLFTTTLTADLSFAPPDGGSDSSSERGDDEPRFLEDPRWTGNTSSNSEDDDSDPPPAVRAYATADGTIYGVDGFVNTDSDDEEEAFWTAQAAEIRRLQAQEETPETTAERINLAHASYERTTLDRASHVRSLTADLSAQEWEERQQHVN